MKSRNAKDSRKAPTDSITISSSGANFRLNFVAGSGDAFGFGASNGGAVASTGTIASRRRNGGTR